MPATRIAICGIFVWGQRNADLRIYETSLLRVNTRIYIEVLQTAADLADLLYENDVRTIHDVKKVLQNASKTFEKVKLQLV